MTLKYVQDHDKYNHHEKSKTSGEVHVEDGEIYLGEKPTGYTVEDQDFNARNLILGVVATVLFFVTDKLGVKVPGHTIETATTEA